MKLIEPVRYDGTMFIDYYEVSGLEPEASQIEVERRYESLKKSYGPHRVGTFGAGLPPELHRAFETLLDPEERRRYDDLRKAALRDRQAHVRDDISSIEPVSLFKSFARVTPSLRRILDHVKQNFRPQDPRIQAHQRNLSLEVLLTEEEAKAGGRIPVEIPCYSPCESCKGAGLLHLVPCESCRGEGLLPGYSTLQVDYPAGLADRAVIRRDLRHLGIFNLVVELRIRITEKVPAI